MPGDRLGRQPGAIPGRRLDGRPPGNRLRPEIGRIRIEAQNDLTPALLYERRESVGKSLGVN
jgi:hypothetical protein